MARSIGRDYARSGCVPKWPGKNVLSSERLNAQSCTIDSFLRGVRQASNRNRTHFLNRVFLGPVCKRW